MRYIKCPGYFWDDYEEKENCHAGTNWPTPCEYNDEPKEVRDNEYC